MEHVDGEPLLGHLRSVFRFNEEKTKFYVMQIVLALRALHRQNIVYRNLKPESILIDKDGYIKLIDFTLSTQLKEADDTTHSFVGTADYMAPEIISKEGHSFEADWWALGVLTFEMVYGFPPFYTNSEEGDN